MVQGQFGTLWPAVHPMAKQKVGLRPARVMDAAGNSGGGVYEIDIRDKPARRCLGN